jgi:hypothetical protein
VLALTRRPGQSARVATRFILAAVLVFAACGQPQEDGGASASQETNSSAVAATLPTATSSPLPTSELRSSGGSISTISAQVGEIWSSYPVSISPRPLVLPWGLIVEPKDGYPDDVSKQAVEAGAIDGPDALPASPGVVDAMPIVSAEEALSILRRGDGEEAQRIKASAVELGIAEFVTDRGTATLPAWLFTFPGVAEPIAVIAVASPARYAAGDSAPIESLMTGHVDASDTAVTVTFTGAAEGDGDCTADYRLNLIEHDTFVEASTTTTRSGGGTCRAVGYRREATASLSRPLAGRVLVDAATGAAVVVAN